MGRRKKTYSRSLDKAVENIRRSAERMAERAVALANIMQMKKMLEKRHPPRGAGRT